MRIGIPREVKDHEYRVGMTPAGVHALIEAGHHVSVEKQAGVGSGIEDAEYIAAGAEMESSADKLWTDSEMIIKVKEPVAEEFPRLQEGQLLFTYLHLAPLPELTSVLLEKKITGVAYETIEDRRGHLPLLTPMSEVAGRMAVLVGAYYQQRPYGGRGTLLSGVPGVPPGDVVILGGGIVGINSAKLAVGLGSRVTVLDTNIDRLRYLDDIFDGRVTTMASNRLNLTSVSRWADLLIGAVLIPGSSAPKLVTREMLADMKNGSVIVDVAVDQGGCVETSRPTTHSDPVFEIDGVVHYCVANMPGAVPRTSTFALTNVTLPYALRLAALGTERAAREDPGVATGVNTYKGHLTCKPVADSQERVYRSLDTLM
jgi:alanine dehydrogenase